MRCCYDLSNYNLLIPHWFLFVATVATPILQLNFDSKEEAIAFAQRNGWEYELQRETSKSNRPAGFNSYKDNFLEKRVRPRLPT